MQNFSLLLGFGIRSKDTYSCITQVSLSLFVIDDVNIHICGYSKYHLLLE